MLSKCANPACQAKFLYLHEGGKVYVADWVASDSADEEFGDTCWRRTEMYWLCEKCSRAYILRKDGSRIVPVKRDPAEPIEGSLLTEIRING